MGEQRAPAGGAEGRPGGVVVVAASAGGPAALTRLLERLPPDFPLPVIVVQHLQPGRPSALARILGVHSSLPVSEARDGEPVLSGHVYVSPPNYHLTLERGGRLRLSDAPPIHFLRPAADILFTSAAESFGAGVIAVVLSGTGSDGAAGARSVREHGGRVVAQDRATSEFFGMPSATIAHGDADYVLSLNEIGDRLKEMSTGAAG
ncbi:MAG: chemotaxis protein CheB [Dehalococcoidia bacterium]|nr:chemotaxis protein CheB [Dehalococcoidia bacterium]